MLDSVPRRRRSRMVLQRQQEEEFTAQFERECAFIGCCLTVETPSSSWCVDRVEEVPQIESVVSHGTQTQLSSTPYSRVTGPPGQLQFQSCRVYRQLVQMLQGHRLLCRDLLESLRGWSERAGHQRGLGHTWLWRRADQFQIPL
jgi:hypothetical protein